MFEECDRDTSTRIAAMVGRKPYMRRNVTASLSINIQPQKHSYNEGEPIEFGIWVTNEGRESVFLQREMGSKDRSSRMDIVVDEGSTVECDDVRNSFDKVTVLEPRRELKPGQMIEMRRENLRRWFIPKTRGAPAFTVVYQFEIYETLNSEYPVWDENFASSFTIKYNGK